MGLLQMKRDEESKEKRRRKREMNKKMKGREREKCIKNEKFLGNVKNRSFDVWCIIKCVVKVDKVTF